MKKIIALAFLLPTLLYAQNIVTLDMVTNSCKTYVYYSLPDDVPTGQITFTYPTTLLEYKGLTSYEGKNRHCFATKGTGKEESHTMTALVQHTDGTATFAIAAPFNWNFEYPETHLYTVSQTGTASFIIQIDPHGVEIIKEKGHLVHFTLPTDWHIMQTDNLSYCYFEKAGPGTNLPPSLVYVTTDESMCYGSWGVETGSFSIFGNESPENMSARDKDNGKNITINIYDLSGIIIYTEKKENTFFNLMETDLKDGIYIVEEINEEGIISRDKISFKR
ncbi:MAG: T9SS type A sorting domain-containing protein [Candidatus Azobacteroides sp.]|nr:T9SS type A sorting domain-containing protein [Candidatus Azobacteroides sp.]